jgi:multimeric flavodoxin WrbA
MILLGSSRKNGNTVFASRILARETGAELFELNNFFIGFYDYENRNSGDDFILLAEKMADADYLIFATPVYWYAMSAQMKVFPDRFTDLIMIRKILGRKLAGNAPF